MLARLTTAYTRPAEAARCLSRSRAAAKCTACSRHCPISAHPRRHGIVSLSPRILETRSNQSGSTLGSPASTSCHEHIVLVCSEVGGEHSGCGRRDCFTSTHICRHRNFGLVLVFGPCRCGAHPSVSPAAPKSLRIWQHAIVSNADNDTKRSPTCALKCQVLEVPTLK